MAWYRHFNQIWRGSVKTNLVLLIMFIVFCVVFCCVLCFICLLPVACVPQVASVSGLSILNCPFGFLQHLFYYLTLTQETIQSILIHRHRYLCKDPRESRHMKTI